MPETAGHPRSRRRPPGGDAAVTDIISNILMVAITVVLIGSLALSVPFVLGDPSESLNADLRASNTDEEMRIAHVGGETIPQDRVQLKITRDGVTTDHGLGEFAGCVGGGNGLADQQWDVGETLHVMCLFSGEDTTVTGVILVAYDAIQVDWTGNVVLGTGSPGNQAPVADADGPYSVDEGDDIVLDGTATDDPDGDLLTVGWTFVGANHGATLSGTDTLTPTFQAPGNVDGSKIVTVELTVDDGSVSDSDQTTVTIEDTDHSGNTPPTADAGGPYTVNEDESILLDGSGSDDPDGDALSYEWSFAGDTHGATLTNRNSVNPTFDAPANVDNDQDVTVRLNASDGFGGSDSDLATVTILDADGSGGGDTTAPTISSFDASNPSGLDVQVTFDSDEQLAVINVTISGADSGFLDTADFTESGSGPYTYTGTFTGSQYGSYQTSLTQAEDAAGNDGASGQSDTVTITTYTYVTSFTDTMGTSSDDANAQSASDGGAEATLEETDQDPRGGVNVDYQLEITADIDGVPDATQQTLQLRYRIDGESSFDLDVLDHSDGTWSTKTFLSSTSNTIVNVTLTADEVDASGNVDVRFVDNDRGSDGSQGHVYLDYLRVESS